MEPTTAHPRTGSVTGGGDLIRMVLGGFVVAFFAGPVRWLQARTWRATVQLAVWCVMSWIFAGLSLVALLVSSAAAGVSEREAAVRSSMLRVIAGTIGLDLRRIETFSAVRIQPIALGRVHPGAPWQERRLALEQAPSRWRLPVYELAEAIAATALTAAAVAWWWATIACLRTAITQAGLYNYNTLHVFGLAIGSARFVDTTAFAVGGAVGVLVWPTAIRLVSVVDVAVARTLLGPGSGELSREVARLSETRTQAVAAADAERRRIERDLHDGFQPQLVNLALNLGLARSRLANDPEGARALLERAHDDAKRATADLRNLVRGIHPSVLDERGLDAAFSALAASSSVPLQIDVHLERRPPRDVEGIAYFVVAEAITNTSKHAGAQTATVTVSEVEDSLWILVQDDGRGGAVPEPGGGLAGLAARIAGVDGTFTVTSPAGGPTWVEAFIPCKR